MDFIKLSETSQFKKSYKNIALFSNNFVEKESCEDVFIFHYLNKLKENIPSYLNHLETNFLETTNIFNFDNNDINTINTQIASISFDLIIIHHTALNPKYFHLTFIKSLINFSKKNDIKIIFDAGKNVKLLNLFYDNQNDLLKEVVENVDLIITSDKNLKTELNNYNNFIIQIPKLTKHEFNLQNFFNILKKWIILFKSIFNNKLILDVIIEYMTESAEYTIRHNSSQKEFKITVVIPIYNTGEKLRRTLKSIEYQTIGIKHVEVLMINDCSTDEITLKILKEYNQKDNFIWIDLKENQGHSGIPRNIGIKEASADYIMFLDHDDFFEITALKRLYDEMVLEENANLDLVFGTYSTIQNEKSVIYFDANDKNGNIDSLSESPRLITYPPPSIWTKLFKKEFIIKNNILFPHILGEDAIFMNKVFFNANGIKYLQKTLITFHDLGKQSITNNVTLKYLSEGIISEQYLKKYFESKDKPNYFKYRVDVLANFYLKKFIDANLTEDEIKLIFPKYLWAMEQVKNYGTELIYNEKIYKIILSDNLEKIITLKLPHPNKPNILYITLLDDTHSFPLIDSINKLLAEVNIFVITYTNFEIKLWSYNIDKFRVIEELEFYDKLPNFYQLDTFYNDIFDNYKIDKIFFRHFESYNKMFFFRSMIQTQRITPIYLASAANIVTVYGKNSNELLNNLDYDYINTTNLNPKNEKGVIYTAIFGDYEPLLDPKIVNEHLDYICFTDNPNLKSDIWTIKLIPDFIENFYFSDKLNNKISFMNLDYTRQARAIKILAHQFLKEYDFSIWVDAGFLIIGDVIEFVNKYSKKDFLGIKHSVRHCIYDEADEVLRLEIDDNNIIQEQINHYKNENYPQNNGLIESGILFRRHNNQKIIKVMEDWYNEIINFSKRDQISFNYVAWKNNLDFDLANIYCTRNPYFHHYFHRINSTINNKATLDELRVILLDNNNLEDIIHSINEIDKINDYIPISIISNDKNIREKLDIEWYNLEIISIENNITSEFINEIISKKSEKYIHLMNAGETLDYEFILNNI